MIILIMKVLLHTVIDWMRTEDEGEDGRNINHHGKTITVGGKQDAVATDIEGVRLIDITTLLVSFNNSPSFCLTRQPVILIFLGVKHEPWRKH